MSIKSLLDKSAPRPLLAIDPSSISLGYAFVDFDTKAPLTQGAIRQPSDGRPWEERCACMALAVGALCGVYKPKLAVIEQPANWHDERGQRSKDREDVQKLYQVVGGIVNVLCTDEYVSAVWGISPAAWKGQTPKPLMERRANAYLRMAGKPELPPGTPHDTAEAVLLAKRAATDIEARGEDVYAMPDPWTLYYFKGQPLEISIQVCNADSLDTLDDVFT